MVDLDSIQEFHSQLSAVYWSLEKLFLISQDQYSDLVDAADPAMIVFRDLLDRSADKGWAA